MLFVVRPRADPAFSARACSACAGRVCCYDSPRQWSLPSLPGKPRKLMTPTGVGNDSVNGRRFMVNYLVVMLGGALGTGARFWLSGFVAERAGEFFPLGTLLVNVSGSFVIGFFAAVSDPAGSLFISPDFRRFFMIGICGGYTTFSSFSLQTLDLAQDGDWIKAGLNIFLSIACCLLAVWLGRISALVFLPR